MPAKILVVDDMAIYRSVISGCIRETAGLELVGTAKDGTEVQKCVEELQPDIITLDMEMPGMGGIDVLKAMQRWPASIKRPHVVVFSALSQAGAAITVEALSLGADDFVLKPTSSEGVKAISEGLIPKLLALFESDHAPKSLATRSMSTIDRSTASRLHTQPRRVLAIASSTGGPQALDVALSNFPSDFPVPILIAQHMPPMFTKTMADRFNMTMALSVQEAEDGMIARPGNAYIAAGDFHMTVRAEGSSGALRICLDQTEKKYGLRPAADNLYNSLSFMAQAVLSAVFTGMGRDGVEGLCPLHARGTAVLTQEADSCVVYGMPQAVDDAQLTHERFTPETFYACVSKYLLKP